MTTPSQSVMILYRRRRFINHLFTYLLNYMLKAPSNFVCHFQMELVHCRKKNGLTARHTLTLSCAHSGTDWTKLPPFSGDSEFLDQILVISNQTRHWPGVWPWNKRRSWDAARASVVTSDWREQWTVAKVVVITKTTIHPTVSRHNPPKQ